MVRRLAVHSNPRARKRGADETKSTETGLPLVPIYHMA